MFDNICNWLATNSNGLMFTLFLCLTLGYLIGKVTIKKISFGATVGCLLVAVVISIIVSQKVDFQIPSTLSSLFFALFIFALGYDVGPAFIRSFKQSGLKLIVMPVIFTASAFLINLCLYYIFHLEIGELIGLLAGGLTQSSILGAAQSTMSTVGLSNINYIKSQMMTSYAVGYLISYAGCVIFIKIVMPYLAGCRKKVDFKNAVKKSIERINYNGDAPKGTIFENIRLRAFKINKGSSVCGMTVDDLQKKFDEQIQIETIIKQNNLGELKTIDFSNSTVLIENDVINIIGNIIEMPLLTELGLTEIVENKYIKAMIVKDKMVITKPISSKEIEDMYSVHVLPVKVFRKGEEVESFKEFKHGDVVTLEGTKTSIKSVIKKYGYPVDTSEASDIIFMGIGCLLGIILGVLSVTVAGAPISLSTSGGLIFLGIFCGWYNDRHPNKGHITTGARWILKNLGLNLFVICLGLTSGGNFISSIKSMGIIMILCIIITAFLPHVITLLISRYVMRLDPVDCLGGICGSGTNTAAMYGLCDEAGSSIFLNSYTPTYAIANIILTFLGTIAVLVYK